MRRDIMGNEPLTATPLQLVDSYMDIIFGGGNPHELARILTPDCHFSGPWLQCDSATAYMDAMNEDPPTAFDYQIIAKVVDGNRVALFYHFRKANIETPMAQLFTTRDDRICDILLVFDTRVFETSR